MLRLNLVSLIAFLYSFLPVRAQDHPVYPFWQDDTILRKQYRDQTIGKQASYIAAAGPQYTKDYEFIYKSHFSDIAALWETSRPVTAPTPHAYIQAVVKKITAANPEIRQTDARVVFTRDAWPNATSMGEGTIVMNAGLMVYLSNEAELAFVLCHELAHYYLDHSNRSIRKSVEEANSEAVREELKKLSKQEYGVMSQLEKLMKKMAFGSRRHSRDHEAEADRQAFVFMKKTGYDLNGIQSCLQLLNHVDDTSLYKPVVPELTFQFESYPFKKKWTQKVSAIFAGVSSDDSPLTAAEKDSLRTHPDCDVRIRLLQDSLKGRSGGQAFLVNEPLFHELKKEFIAEMTEQEFRDGNLARNFYHSVQLLQNETYRPLAIYSIARDLNILHDRQKNHKLGDIDRESRAYDADYNLVLRMLDRLRLEEIALLNYYFCKKYEGEMDGYDVFKEELTKAVRNAQDYR